MDNVIIKDDKQNWEEFKIYTKNDIASPLALKLDEEVSGLTVDEILKAHELLMNTGRAISTSQSMRSPKQVFRSILKIRSFSDIKRHANQLYSLFSKKGKR